MHLNRDPNKLFRVMRQVLFGNQSDDYRVANESDLLGNDPFRSWFGFSFNCIPTCSVQQLFSALCKFLLGIFSKSRIELFSARIKSY